MFVRRLILILFLFTGTGKIYSQAPATQEHIKILLEVSGSAKLGVQLLNNMISTLKQSYPSVPQEFWGNFLKEAKPETLIDMMIPIYAKYYTDDDVKGLIGFYKSPLGEKVINTLPLISQEAYTVGVQWGQQVSDKIAQELIEKGYDEKQ